MSIQDKRDAAAAAIMAEIRAIEAADGVTRASVDKM